MSFFRSRIFVVGVTATVTAIAVGSVAWAVTLQNPVDNNGVVHGCYNPSNGNFHLNVTGGGATWRALRCFCCGDSSSDGTSHRLDEEGSGVDAFRPVQVLLVVTVMIVGQHFFGDSLVAWALTFFVAILVACAIRMLRARVHPSAGTPD